MAAVRRAAPIRASAATAGRAETAGDGGTALPPLTDELVAHGDEVNHRRGSGERHLIYSVTKAYLAVLLLRLRVRLDESVRAWFDDPRLPDASLRRLLNHTSGIPDPSGRTARSSGTAAAGRGPRRLPSSCFGNGPMIAVVLSDDSELPAETRAHELLTAAIRDGR